MIKKVTALFFILLANIILLAHVVIPHHHHNDKICVVSSHCEAESESHEHCDAENHHEDDTEDSSKCCVLKQLFIVPSNHENEKCECSDCTDNHSQSGKFQAVLFGEELHNLSRTILLNRCILLPPDYSYFTGISLCLRAPPPINA